MKTTALALLGVICAWAVPTPDVDTVYPYAGPALPVGDWVDQTINGNGKGYPRLVEPPAVVPAYKNATNNINVISTSYIPNGVNIHFQTPFGLKEQPTVFWGEHFNNLTCMSRGQTKTYDRTPPCSLVSATQCSQFFHDVQIEDLKPGKTYFYQIAASNGTTESDVLSLKTPPSSGDRKSFTVAVLNDMGYTNADGTYKYLLEAAVNEEVAFAWHGGDISYADDWYDGLLPCADDWPVCYNGTSTEIPSGDYPEDYSNPLPAGESPNQGGPRGGDMSVIYETNWDLWQQWMNNITEKIPYMVLPGNHDIVCGGYDGPGNVLTAYLTDGIANGTSPTENLTYYSCPPSQRNFTAYQHRFRMPGKETGGVDNIWYSFDYGLAHFIALDAETDFAHSPSAPFAQDIASGSNPNETHPTVSETFITDAGPMGEIEGGRVDDNKAYEQYRFLVKDLEAVDRTKTPWVIVMSHRPMYSTQTSAYQAHVRAAWEDVLLRNGVDVYLAGHIHWYERLFPLGLNGTIDTASIVDNSTFYTNPGKSMTHIINGMAGNVESHSTLDEGESTASITAVLDDHHFGFSKLTVESETELKWQFIMGHDGSVGDELTLKKKV